MPGYQVDRWCKFVDDVGAPALYVEERTQRCRRASLDRVPGFSGRDSWREEVGFRRHWVRVRITEIVRCCGCVRWWRQIQSVEVGVQVIFVQQGLSRLKLQFLEISRTLQVQTSPSTRSLLRNDGLGLASSISAWPSRMIRRLHSDDVNVAQVYNSSASGWEAASIVFVPSILVLAPSCSQLRPSAFVVCSLLVLILCCGLLAFMLDAQIKLNAASRSCHDRHPNLLPEVHALPSEELQRF